MYNPRARSKSKSKVDVTPINFPPVYAPLPSMHDKSRMKEKQRANPYDRNRAVSKEKSTPRNSNTPVIRTPNPINQPPPQARVVQSAPQQHQTATAQPTPIGTAAAALRPSGLTDPRRNRRPQNATPAVAPLHRQVPTVTPTRVQQPPPPMSRKIPAATPTRVQQPPPKPSQQTTATTAQAVPPMSRQVPPVMPTRVQQPPPSKPPQQQATATPAQAVPPMRRQVPPVMPTHGQGPQQQPPSKPPQQQVMGTTTFINWAVRNPGEFSMSKSKTPQRPAVERQMPVDAFLDEPDDRPMDVDMDSVLSESTVKLDTLLNRILPSGKKRPRSDYSDEENPGQGVKRVEMEREQATNSTASENATSTANEAAEMAAWALQPGLAQEIDAHFEQADEREARTDELQRSFHQFLESITERCRLMRLSGGQKK